MAKYICKKKCYIGGKLWEIGQVWNAAKLPCEHFELEADIAARIEKEALASDGGSYSDSEPRTLSDISKANDKMENDALPANANGDLDKPVVEETSKDIKAFLN